MIIIFPFLLSLLLCTVMSKEKKVSFRPHKVGGYLLAHFIFDSFVFWYIFLLPPEVKREIDFEIDSRQMSWVGFLSFFSLFLCMTGAMYMCIHLRSWVDQEEGIRGRMRVIRGEGMDQGEEGKEEGDQRDQGKERRRGLVGEEKEIRDWRGRGDQGLERERRLGKVEGGGIR